MRAHHTRSAYREMSAMTSLAVLSSLTSRTGAAAGASPLPPRPSLAARSERLCASCCCRRYSASWSLPYACVCVAPRWPYGTAGASCITQEEGGWGHVRARSLSHGIDLHTFMLAAHVIPPPTSMRSAVHGQVRLSHVLPPNPGISYCYLLVTSCSAVHVHV